MIECLEFRAFERNTLRGFAKIRVPQWRLVFDDVAVHEKNGKRWAMPPSKPQLDKNRELIKEPDGKIRYGKIIEFDDVGVSKRFSEAVVKAVAEYVAEKEALL